VLAGDGTVDGHYALVISPDLGFPGPNALTITSNVWPIPPWLTDDSNSKWIGPQASQSSGNAPGDYTYETRFDLTGFNYSTAILVGQFAADDSVAIKLNGTTVVANTPGFSLLTPFTINSGFISGMNTLDFVVTNGGASTNPTGLRVDISGTVSR
jgi:hypothetical protein